MKLGIATASFFNRIQTESCFDALRQLRIETTEVSLCTFSEYEKPFIDALVPRKEGLNVHSVHPLSTQYEPQLFNVNARVREDAETIFRKVCYAGSMLGAKFYTFHGPVRLKIGEYVFDYVRLGERINQLIEIAQSYGIQLSYENVHWTYGKEPEFFKQILKQCPTLYTTLDVKQAMQSGIDVNKFLDAMGRRISTIHLCDVQKNGQTALPMPKSRFRFDKFFRELEKREINAHAFLEVYANNYRDLKDLKLSYEHLLNLMNRAKK